ncbi:MAG TPA: hypothetical protein VGC76_00935 [Pyrinomonadaceae bacterium]|jgi:hypothetical protein
MKKLEVSFNSPQCGWMSIGFDDGANEFHTTTAHTPHSHALSEILKGLKSLLETENAKDEFVIAWSRNPEAFDLRFKRDADKIAFRVIEYPTGNRLMSESKIVFSHEGAVKDLCSSFYQTFEQLYRDRETDEFEFNWRQPFPFEEYAQFKSKLEEMRI